MISLTCQPSKIFLAHALNVARRRLTRADRQFVVEHDDEACRNIKLSQSFFQLPVVIITGTRGENPDSAEEASVRVFDQVKDKEGTVLGKVLVQL